jgi:hypothetical protein
MALQLKIRQVPNLFELASAQRGALGTDDVNLDTASFFWGLFYFNMPTIPLMCQEKKDNAEELLENIALPY